MSWLPIVLCAAVAASPKPVRDTDGDGIPDHIEDADGDGVVGPGETNPRDIDTDHDNVPDDVERSLGTDPQSTTDVPPIPEPLYIDLIRNLGSRRGEIEANVLAATRFRKQPAIVWGPEIEYVVVPNLAVEFEVPFVDNKVEALKGGLQTRLLSLGQRRVEIGVLAVGYHLLAEKETVLEPTALFALRFTRKLQALVIVGPTAAVSVDGAVRVGTMFHPSLFFQASRRLTLGVETGYRARSEEARTAYVLPQFHANVMPWMKLQLGAGVAIERPPNSAAIVQSLVAIRLSVER
jgi:hypothetical protein